ncbi:MAG: hypothetical protein ACYCTL_02480 [Acidimicrobiales bacterium]
MANETKKQWGINVDYHGDPVGLWFDPASVEMDEHAYVFMGEEEPAELSDLQRALPVALFGRGAGPPSVDRGVRQVGRSMRPLSAGSGRSGAGRTRAGGRGHRLGL